MNEMTSYLNCHPEIEKAVLLVGNNYNYSCLKEFIKDSCLKELVLVGSLLKREIDDIFQNLKRDEGNGQYTSLEKFEYFDFQDFHGCDGEWALCC